MTIDELKAKVEAHREGLEKKSGLVSFSKNGPVGMSLIDALVATVEAQQKQIDEIRNKPSEH